MRRVFLSLSSMLILVAMLAAPVGAAPGDTFPNIISLPIGFAPEGIASGRGTTFFAGSLNLTPTAGITNGIYRGDLRTGQGAVLPGTTDLGRTHVGMKLDQRSNALFVAGGTDGKGYVYDADSGAQLATYEFTPGGFINDVTLTSDAAYFTNSAAAFFYIVPLGPSGRPAAPTATIQGVPLTGDWGQVAGFNANGIASTTNGRHLIIVNSTSGLLYRVDPNTGVATEIDLGGATVTMGDGIWLHGKTLHVVRNRANEIVVIDLAPDYLSGAVVGTITNSAFNVPTTLAQFGGTLYAVNAKFGTPRPDTPYEVVKVTP